VVIFDSKTYVPNFVKVCCYQFKTRKWCTQVYRAVVSLSNINHSGHFEPPVLTFSTVRSAHTVRLCDSHSSRLVLGMVLCLFTVRYAPTFYMMRVWNCASRTMSWLRWLVASSHLGVSFGSPLSSCEICRRSDSGVGVSTPSASSSQLLLTEGEEAEAW
jgi:hypothetical protein